MHGAGTTSLSPEFGYFIQISTNCSERDLPGKEIEPGPGICGGQAQNPTAVGTFVGCSVKVIFRCRCLMQARIAGKI